MFFSVLLLFGCTPQPNDSSVAIKRVALVIGNQNYKDNRLENPIYDAKGVKEVLEKIGFEVILGLDLNHSQFNRALEELKSKIEPHKTLVFIYFAGHGNTLQSNSSEQFLMMTDPQKPVLVSIFKLYSLLEEAEGRYNIVAIDACRDYQKHYIAVSDRGNKTTLDILPNSSEVLALASQKGGAKAPLPRNYRGNFKFKTRQVRFSEGVTTDIEVIRDDKNYFENLPKSTIISFATQRNQTAKDWSIYDSKHSPYSYALIKHLDDEEIPIEELFKRMQREINIETDGKQVNTSESTLFKNIWLVPKRAEIAVAPPL